VNRPTKPALLVVAAIGTACTSSTGSQSPARGAGPPAVRSAVVARHAEQFDSELARRVAGSQQEEAAASYILAHLQRAGYTARLEAVPVANTVSSTDVIALPPSGDDPRAVVAVAYDTAQGLRSGGSSIGLFLELARALKVAERDHSVEFAALGAERTARGGGHLGARRLARLLLDEGDDPQVITIEALGGEAEGKFGAFGPDVDRFTDIARRLDIPVIPLPAPDPRAGRDLAGRARVFEEAGLDHVAVTGGVEQVGDVLLEYLETVTS
jgi:hypothetical protein